ncbi:alpha/beta fold hydrolase [Williamsia sp. CHRR-6]|uniref:alpha/beta fold hydrolase n=1 Tax=Williamsia sp. CHRR-6 TaxID=2835871 RepID=UPI001BDAFC32|nr:alpha/beta fold hydrolase [Williamsia sp. CHRR-6]MBT0566484.1 alpha/beta fold hydrolase [Williamsia sp. CHRR-6]
MSGPSRRLLVGAIGLLTPLVVAVLPAPATAAPASTEPDTMKLAGTLSKQKVVWGECFDIPPGTPLPPSLANIKCATVQVPRDWKKPTNGKIWNIKISYAFNISTDNPRHKGTIFTNPGGPGSGGIDLPISLQEGTPDLKPYYNYLGFDPRGVGQSDPATCRVTTTEPGSLKELYRIVAPICAANEDVKTINSQQTAYDMDFIRGLLKEPKMDYIGYSYGTWLGTTYASLFPSKVNHMYLDSAADVTKPTLQSTQEFQYLARDRSFALHLANYISRHDDLYKLGTIREDIVKRYFAATAKLDRGVVKTMWAFDNGLAGLANNKFFQSAANVFTTLVQMGEQPIAAPSATGGTAAALISSLDAVKVDPDAPAVAKETAATVSAAAAPLVGQNPDEPQTFDFTDSQNFIRCGDGQWTQGTAYYESLAARLTTTAPFDTQVDLVENPPFCAFFPTSNLNPVAPKNFPKVLFGQSEFDAQVGYESGLASVKGLPGAKLLAIDNEGTHGLFPYGTECFDRPIIDFFLTGKLPSKKVTVCQAKPLPGETTTYESGNQLDARGRGSVTLIPRTPRQERAVADLHKQLDRVTFDNTVAPQLRELYGDRGVEIARKNAG